MSPLNLKICYSLPHPIDRNQRTSENRTHPQFSSCFIFRCVCVRFVFKCSESNQKRVYGLRTMEVKHWRKKLGSSSRWPQRMEENFKLPFRCYESCVTFLFYFCHLFFSVFNPVRKRIQITFLLTPGQLENYNFFRGILFTTLGNYEGMPIFYIY